MDKIVDINERIAREKQAQQLKLRREKVEAIQKVTQCSSCHFRCAMCGLHIRPDDQSSEALSTSSGFPLCESCRGEFDDYQSIARDKKPSDLFWHNKEWENMWSAWLRYQKAITGFINSREFQRLIEDSDS